MLAGSLAMRPSLPRARAARKAASISGAVEAVCGAGEVGELAGDPFQVARIEFDALAALVELAADAVVFLLEPDGRRQPGENGFGRRLGTRQHELQRIENVQLDVREFFGAGGPRD